MTRRQIDASRERRLWISQVLMPAATMAVGLLSIPVVRETVKAKATEIRIKAEDQIKKFREGGA